MSITEKLAQCVRFCEPYLAGRVASLRRSGGPISNDAAIEVESDLAALREALAEYYASQSAPAGEVTADAEGAFLNAWEANAGLSRHDQLQAALAAAYPAVQQVERLTTGVAGLQKECDEVEQRLGRALGYPRYCDDQKVFPGATDADGVCIGEHVTGTIAREAANKIETLSAANARLAKDAERYRWLKSRSGKMGSGTFYIEDICGDHETLEAAIDAATAQAKQAEGGT